MTEFLINEEDFLNYYLSLKTKPFVLLMGLSGSGKTQLARRFAQNMNEDIKSTGKKGYTFIPVEAGWVDNSHLLGYFNPISNVYLSNDLVDLIINARNDFLKNELFEFRYHSEEANNKKVEKIKLIKEKSYKISPYFVILDEMNLSKVEYYFSKFLSILETKEDISYNGNSYRVSEKIFLHNNKQCAKINASDVNCPIYDFYKQKGEAIEYCPCIRQCSYIVNDISYIPPYIHIPPNIYFTGTVNMDETTYMFSPKVLDRANSIELTNINTSEFFDKFGMKESRVPTKIKLNEKLLEDFTYNYTFQFTEVKMLKELYLNFEIDSIDTSDFEDISIVEEKISLPTENSFNFLNELFTKLNNKIRKLNPRFCFGYRVLNEILMYIENALNLSDQLKDSDDLVRKEKLFYFALDKQLKQKILPKIHGMDSEVEDIIKKALDIDKLEIFGSQYKLMQKLYDYSEKLTNMKNDLERKGFTSYM